MGHATPYVPKIRIIEARQARERGLTGRPFELPFGDNQDGTKLVLDFLEEARRAGATHVSDIRIVLVTRGAQARRCSTRLLPFAKRHDYKVPHVIPARTEQRSVLRPVTQTVTEYQQQCQMVSHPVSRMETSYQYQYDYASHSSRSVPVTRMVTSYEYRNECRSVPVTRTVTRYEHQLETRYIPAQLTYIAAHFTDFDLIESRPECEPTADPGGAKLVHRISGLIYTVGQ
jgi:hypothetical protein